MPGFDGTGPSRQGVMTGKGRGYCIKALEPKEKEGLLNRAGGFTSKSKFGQKSNLGRGMGCRRFGDNNK